MQRNADGAVEIVGADALQRKAGEPYFAGALNAAPGTAYLSEINLNREYGEIQQPQIPVLRAAVPVPTADGQPYGMLVINLDMRPSLATLTRGLATENRYYITNALSTALGTAISCVPCTGQSLVNPVTKVASL